LGIKELLPAYLDKNTKVEDLPTGVCFASGGSGYDSLAPTILVCNLLFFHNIYIYIYIYILFVDSHILFR
jgi:hypothetical protein